jgi:hypothetical protein
VTVPAGFPLDDGPLIGTWPRILIQIAWNAGGNSTAPNHWYTVSKRLRGQWKATLAGRQYELDTVTSGQMTFSLDNLDGAFDPDNTASFFYPYVLPYRRARLVAMVNPTRNLLYPWVANATLTQSMAVTAGTLTTASGLSASPSGLTTAYAWTLPNGTGQFVGLGLSGAIQAWTGHDCEGTTVTPGASYSAGVDLQLASGGMTSLSCQVKIQWYDLVGNQLAQTNGPSVAVTTAWQRTTVSGTAPARAAFGIPLIVTLAATTATTTVRATAWQLEQAAASTAYAFPGGWAQLWQGFAERWTQHYDQNGKYGLVDVPCVDGLAPLSQYTFTDSEMATYVGLSSPQYLFPLSTTTASPDGAAAAFPDSVGTATILDVIGANYLTGQSIGSTSSLGTLWNVPGPVMSLVSNQASSLGTSSGATYLQPRTSTGATVVVPGTGGWSRAVCFNTTNTPGTGGRFTTAVLWAATASGYSSGSGDMSGVVLTILSSGVVQANIQRADGNNQILTSTQKVCDGNWHCAILSLSADGKTVRLTVDGTQTAATQGADLHSGTCTQDAIGTLLVGAGTNTTPFNGNLAYAGQWTSELSATAADQVARGFATGWYGDTIAARVSRILTIAGFHPGAGVSYSSVGTLGTLAGMSLSGRSALDCVQEAADTECGQFAIDRYGTPTLYGHLWRWIQNTPLATFGENTTGGEIPYLGDVTFEQDPGHLYNDVQVTCDNASDADGTNGVQEVTDSASATAYFPQSLTRTVNTTTVQGGLDIANYLLSQYKDPHTRVNGVTIDLASSPSLQNSVSGLKFADLVRVNRRPALAPSKTLDGFIEQIEWSGDNTGQVLQLHLQVSPASQYRYWLVSAAWAALSTTIASGVGVITVGPVSGNSAIAAQYVIPAGFTMVLGYGTANAETVVVQSVQTVTAGYSTVQLTLAANTTKSHTAGDLICSPLPGTATLPPGGTYPTCFDAAAVFGGTSPLFGF